MQAGDIQQGDQLFDDIGNLVWTVLWNPQPFDRERIALRLLWDHDKGETDRAYRNEIELNIVRPTPPEDPPPEDPPADPEEPPAEDPPPSVDPDPLEQGENTVTPDPPADEPPAEG
jgi:hypothetical protein